MTNTTTAAEGAVTRATKAAKVVGEVCFYGTGATGAGFIATNLKTKERFGTGDPVQWRSFTSALWIATDALRLSGITKGVVRVYSSCGELQADVSIAHVPAYGDLKWKAVEVVYALDWQAVRGASVQG